MRKTLSTLILVILVSCIANAHPFNGKWLVVDLKSGSNASNIQTSGLIMTGAVPTTFSFENNILKCYDSKGKVVETQHYQVSANKIVFTKDHKTTTGKWLIDKQNNLIIQFNNHTAYILKR